MTHTLTNPIETLNKHRARDREDAFGLLDLLLSMVITGLIGAITVVAIATFSKAPAMFGAKTDTETDLTAANTYLENKIGDARSLVSAGSAGFTVSSLDSNGAVVLTSVFVWTGGSVPAGVSGVDASGLANISASASSPVLVEQNSTAGTNNGQVVFVSSVSSAAPFSYETSSGLSLPAGNAALATADLDRVKLINWYLTVSAPTSSGVTGSTALQQTNEGD